MLKHPIYLDNHATTPLDPRVLDAMMPFLTTEFGNPASKTHAFGWKAEEAVEKARGQVAGLLGAQTNEIVFTSGATESNNLAIFGAAHAYQERGHHLITSKIEHHAVLDAVQNLQKKQFSATYLAPAHDGIIHLDSLEEAMRHDTIFVSLMLVNNEIGVINPIEQIGKKLKERAIFHCDAVQGIGRVPFNVQDCEVDLVSISGHKIYGPKGIGALYVRKSPRVMLKPMFCGGGQEYGMRSGTLNVPGIVGLGMACQLAHEEREAEHARISELRNYLWQQLSKLGGVGVNGCMQNRVAGNLSVYFEDIFSERLLLALSRDIAVSASSACTSSGGAPSHVLEALSGNSCRSASTLRFGLGRFTTAEEIDHTIKIMAREVTRLRAEGKPSLGIGVTLKKKCANV